MLTLINAIILPGQVPNVLMITKGTITGQKSPVFITHNSSYFVATETQPEIARMVSLQEQTPQLPFRQQLMLSGSFSS